MGTWTQGWGSEPGTVVSLAVLAFLFIRGSQRLHTPRRDRIGWFAVGFSMLAVALVSPLHVASGETVSAHMAQHALLLLAPLPLAFARTGTRVVQAIAPTWRGQIAQRLRSASRWWTGWGAVTALLVVTVVVWHSPAVFEIAARVPALHALEHISLVAVAAAYWGKAVSATTRRGDPARAVASMFAIFVLGAAAGALVLFASVPLYPGYTTVSGWRTDQQMAAVLMTAPLGISAVVMSARIVWRWTSVLGWAPASRRTE